MIDRKATAQDNLLHRLHRSQVIYTLTKGVRYHRTHMRVFIARDEMIEEITGTCCLALGYHLDDAGWLMFPGLAEGMVSLLSATLFDNDRTAFYHADLDD